MFHMIQTLHRNLTAILGNYAFWALLVAIAWMIQPQAAYAQASVSVSRGNDGVINAGQACTASPLVRTFNVSDSFVIGDVDFGVIVAHTWRGDLQITLESPGGTRVQLTNGDVNNINGNNFNVLLNDEGTQLVNTDGNTVEHDDAQNAPFEHDFIPNNALSAFDGENSAGTWRMEICDLFPTDDDGTFRYAELFITEFVATADLSLTKTVNNSNPTFGSTVDFILTLDNDGTAAATNVEVLDQLPVGFDFDEAIGFGNYDAATGIWSVPSIPSNSTRTITLRGTVSAPNGVTITNFAEISAADQPDSDSTPGNNSTNEDDDDSASFTVQGARTAGTPPALVCPVGTRPLDWDAPGVQWVTGQTIQAFTIANFGEVSFNVTNQGTFQGGGAFGTATPSESTANSGGLPGAQSALNQLIDFDNRQQTATTEITLPTGIPGAQFIIFDVDFGTNDFADKVTVTGSYKGATVIPELTNGTANYVVGNTAIGDAASAGTSGAANVVVTFDQAIDAITIVYGNAPTAPVVPDGQAIAIHDFNFCAPQTQLTVTKESSVISDPINTEPGTQLAIPGATIEYTITVTNTGISATDPGTVVISDLHFGDIQMCRLDRTIGPIDLAEPNGDTGLDIEDPTALSFSQVGNASFNYGGPTDGSECDDTIDGFRFAPSGSMLSGTVLTLKIRYEILDPAITPPDPNP